MELLGPYFFIRDPALINVVTGIVLCILLIPSMAVVLIKPFRIWKLVLAVVAVAVWILTGVIGRAINA